MKKFVFLSLLAVLVLPGCPTGTESKPKAATVSEARGMKDGSFVKISGAVTEVLIEKFYLFSDSTGSISLKIDNEVWARAGISPLTLILPANFEITGELDKEKGEEPIIEVESLKKL